MNDGQGGMISTEPTEKISPVFGAGTLLLRDLPPGRSLGRKHAGLLGLSQDAAGGEREPPSRVDKQRLRPGRLHPEQLVRLPLHWPPQARRRIQFFGRLSAICGSAVRRTALSPPSRFGRCVPARHVPTESPLPVENVLDVHIWTPLRDGVPPLRSAEATIAWGPARKEERIDRQLLFASGVVLGNGA